MSFDQFRIDPRCLRVLERQKITVPTPVQAESIPVALEGRDVVAVAQTGTGKTLAFGLPAITRLAEQKPGRNRMLVLAPTRELAQQVFSVIEPLAKAVGIRATCIFGGVGMEPQTRALRHGMDIIVATPGRLLDHVGRGNIRFDKLDVLVLDEADRMLDMGFLPDIKRIISELPRERQTLMFSATFPKEIRGLTNTFQNDPALIEFTVESKPDDAVRQGVYTVHATGKFDLLAKLLSEPHVESAIVFLRTKHRTERIAKLLYKEGFKAEAIHGGRSQSQRQRALEGFRRGKCRILVATDVAARGIDVRGVTHVVNFDVPNTYEDYVHRIGRTARADADGDAITFISPEDHAELGAIERGLGKRIDQIEWEGAVPVIISSSVGGGNGRGRGRSGGRSGRPQQRRGPRQNQRSGQASARTGTGKRSFRRKSGNAA